MELHRIRLSRKTQEKLHQEARKSKVKVQKDTIDYKVALRVLQPDMELDEPLMHEWIIKLNDHYSRADQISLKSNMSRTFY